LLVVEAAANGQMTNNDAPRQQRDRVAIAPPLSSRVDLALCRGERVLRAGVERRAEEWVRPASNVLPPEMVAAFAKASLSVAPLR
jgi:hypothetical protein